VLSLTTIWALHFI